MEASLYEHHEKAVRVILSCNTVSQITSAVKYCDLLIKSHRKYAADAKNRRGKYNALIEESKELLSRACEDRVKLLKMLNQKHQDD